MEDNLRVSNEIDWIAPRLAQLGVVKLTIGPTQFEHLKEELDIYGRGGYLVPSGANYLMFRGLRIEKYSPPEGADLCPEILVREKRALRLKQLEAMANEYRR